MFVCLEFNIILVLFSCELGYYNAWTIEACHKALESSIFIGFFLGTNYTTRHGTCTIRDNQREVST